MLDEFRNISILNHFLQNVTCSMWVVGPTLSRFFFKNYDLIFNKISNL